MGIDNLSSHSVYCSLECPTLNDYMPVISNLTVKLIKPRKNRTLLHPFNILCLSGPQVYASEYWEHGSWANSSTYLGSIQSSDGYCRDGLKKTYQPGILYHALNRIWRDKWLLLWLKLHKNHMLVLSTLIHAAEMWTLWPEGLKSLEAFHTKSLRLIIMGIHWSDFIPSLMLSYCHYQKWFLDPALPSLDILPT